MAGGGGSSSPAELAPAINHQTPDSIPNGNSMRISIVLRDRHEQEKLARSIWNTVISWTRNIQLIAGVLLAALRARNRLLRGLGVAIRCRVFAEENQAARGRKSREAQVK